MVIEFTAKEEALLRPEYEEYLAWFKKWMIPEAIPDSFNFWCLAMADNIKENREGK